MNFFAKPGRFIMNRLPYYYKFLLIGIVLLIPAGVTLYQFLNSTHATRTKLERELQGLEYFQPLGVLIRDIRVHRDLSTAALVGYTGFTDAYEQVEQDIEANLRVIDDLNAKYEQDFGLTEAWAHVKEEWEKLENPVAKQTTLEHFLANTTMVDAVYDFRIKVANNSGLILDSEVDTYYMMDLITNDLVELTETVARARGLGTLLVASKSLGDEVLGQLRELNALVDIRMDSVTEFIDYVSPNNPTFKQLADSEFTATIDSVPTYFQNIEATFVENPTSVRLLYVNRTDPKAFFDEASQTVNKLYNIEAESIPILGQALQTRIDTLTAERTEVLVVTIFALLIAIYLLDAFYRTVVATIKRLEEAAKRLASGEPAPAVVLETQDELGQVAVSFNTVGGALVKSNQELVKRARELEVANALAREASRVKSHFLSTMSHELRTPMNAIVGFTDLLLTEKPGPLTTIQRTFLERTSGNNRRLLTLINDVLDLSRIEAGRMEIVPKPYTVRDMIERITAQTSSLFSQKGIQFETQVDANLPETVIGDSGRVEQVIVNLLSNAAKFTSAGYVQLKVAMGDQDRWSIAVTDTGKGISPHMQEIIFEPFRQVEGGTTREMGGSGLGLAISRELVQMMDGTLTVRSEIGKGSTFTVNLPLTSAHPAAQAELAANIA